MQSKDTLLAAEAQPMRSQNAVTVAFTRILSDGPIATGLSTRGSNHLLGEVGIGFFAANSTAAKLRRGFPKSLDGAAVLLPSEGTVVR